MSASQFVPHPFDTAARQESLRDGVIDAAVRAEVDSFHLSRVLHSLGPLPGVSLFLGICEDGLPLLLDLLNPSPGPVLILGDSVNANLALLRTALASVAMLDRSVQVRVDLVSSAPEMYGEFLTDGGRFDYVLDGSPVLEALIVDYAVRLNGDGGNPGLPGTRLMVFDDLEAALGQLSNPALNALRWVLDEGPEAGLWVLAALHTRNFRQVEDPLLQAFGTRLFGKIRPLWLAEYLTGLPGEVSASLTGEDQFCTQVMGAITPFWLPYYDFVTEGA